jgi:hypothetical protein
MGLPDEAVTFLAANAVRANPCSHCDRDDGPVSKVVGHVGMFDDLALREYELTDGRTAKEFVQEEIWSSGPMIWVALELSDGTRIEWDPKHLTEDYGPKDDEPDDED